MWKARLPQQAYSDDTIQTSASSSRGSNAGEPSLFGYWSKEEVLNFLNELLESERIGVTAYAAIGRTADSHAADLALESELAQGAICILLKKEIAARVGAGMLRQQGTAAIPNVEYSPRRMIAFAIRNSQSGQIGRYDRGRHPECLRFKTKCETHVPAAATP
jgi:hypothetical protein